VRGCVTEGDERDDGAVGAEDRDNEVVWKVREVFAGCNLLDCCERHDGVEVAVEVIIALGFGDERRVNSWRRQDEQIMLPVE